MMPNMGMPPGPGGPGGPPPGVDPRMAMMMAAMMQARGGAPGGPPPGMPPPGQGAPPMPPGAQAPPSMPIPVPSMGAPTGPPPGPPISRPGMTDQTNKGLLMMVNIGQQILRQMDPSSEQADRLASVLRDLDEILARLNSSSMGGYGPGGNPRGERMGPEHSNMTHMMEAGDGARL